MLAKLKKKTFLVCIETWSYTLFLNILKCPLKQHFRNQSWTRMQGNLYYGQQTFVQRYKFIPSQCEPAFYYRI